MQEECYHKMLKAASYDKRYSFRSNFLDSHSLNIAFQTITVQRNSNNNLYICNKLRTFEYMRHL